MKKTVATAPNSSLKPRGRRPGRPADAAAGRLDRETIIAFALQLTKTIPLGELSLIQVAHELGVTPASLYHHLDGHGRDGLVSGVMNAFYKEIVTEWPPERGDWRHNLDVVTHSIYRAYLRYPGVTLYAASHNRFKLVQSVREGEADYGPIFFEKTLKTMRQLGFDAKLTAVNAHLIMMFITSCALSTVTYAWPSQHDDFLNTKLASLDATDFPNIHFVLNSISQLSAIQMFTTGLNNMLRIFELQREDMRLTNETQPGAPETDRVHPRRRGVGLGAARVHDGG